MTTDDNNKNHSNLTPKNWVVIIHLFGVQSLATGIFLITNVELHGKSSPKPSKLTVSIAKLSPPKLQTQTLSENMFLLKVPSADSNLIKNSFSS